MGYKAGYSMATLTRLLNKIRDLDITNTGWQKLSSTQQSPVFLDDLLTPGNYSITYWRQGPASVTSSIPINIVISKKNDIIYQTVFYMTTIFERLYDEPTAVWGSWAQLQGLTDSEFTNTEPLNPSDNMIWFDISTSAPIIKVFNAALGRWWYVQPDDLIKISVYDPQGIATDYFAYIANHIESAGLNDAHSVFEAHISDENIHITASERDTWNSAQDDSDMESDVNTTMNSVKDTVADLVNSARNSTEDLQNQSDTLSDAFNAHVSNTKIHPSHDIQNDWISKADGAHEHYLDSRVTISPDDVTGGLISVSRFDTGAMERGIDVESTTEMLALTVADVQNGDSVFNKENQFAHFVIDQTKLGSMDAFLQYSVYQVEFTWKNLMNKPTTISGYGITDAYTATEIDTIVTSVVEDATKLKDNAAALATTLSAISTPSTASALSTTISTNQSSITSVIPDVDTMMSLIGISL